MTELTDFYSGFGWVGVWVAQEYPRVTPTGSESCLTDNLRGAGAYPAAGFPKSVDQVCAMPSVLAKGTFKAVPSHYDIVLVHEADISENQHTKGTCLEGMCVWGLITLLYHLTRITQ